MLDARKTGCTLGAAFRHRFENLRPLLRVGPRAFDEDDGDIVRPKVVSQLRDATQFLTLVVRPAVEEIVRQPVPNDVEAGVCHQFPFQHVARLQARDVAHGIRRHE